jgi:hypothetical protein
MSKKQSGFFIAGGLEFLVLAALLGGYAATDQTEQQKATAQGANVAQVEQIKAPVLPGNGFTRLDSNLIAVR